MDTPSLYYFSSLPRICTSPALPTFIYIPADTEQPYHETGGILQGKAVEP